MYEIVVNDFLFEVKYDITLLLCQKYFKRKVIRLFVMKICKQERIENEEKIMYAGAGTLYDSGGNRLFLR